MTTVVEPRRGALHSRAQSSILRSFLRDPWAMAGAFAVLLVIVFAFAGPYVAPYPPEEFVGPVFQKPSPEHLLGLDVLGRDVLSRLLVGGRSFLIEGVAAATLGVGLGIVLGIALNLIPRTASRVALFVNDTIMVIPQILMVLIIIAAFGASPVTVTLAGALALVTYTARLANAATKRAIGEDYVRSAQSLGASPVRIMVAEILPNISGPILVEFGVRLAVSLVAIASLSYLGFGGSGPEWGRMIHENQGGILIQPAAALSPVFVIAVFLIGMNLMRDGLARANARRSAR